MPRTGKTCVGLLVVAILACGVSAAPAAQRPRQPVEVSVKESQAVEIALREAGEGEVVRKKLAYKKYGVAVYEILVVNEEGRTTVQVDANTAEVVKVDKKPIDRDKIDPRLRDKSDDQETNLSHEEAKKMVVDALGEGTVIAESKKLYKKGGDIVFSVEAYQNGNKIMVEIDANTKEIKAKTPGSRGPRKGRTYLNEQDSSSEP